MNNNNYPRRNDPRPIRKEEFKERVLDMRRVTRVVAGGKRFRFRATLVLGDEKGRIGVGIAKGLDVQQAVAKAKVDAKKNMIMVALKDGRTITHEVLAKYSAAKVLLKPASKGHGLRAGGAALRPGIRGYQGRNREVLGSYAEQANQRHGDD